MAQVPDKVGKRFGGLLVPCLGIALFVAALWIFHKELHRFRYRDILNNIRQIPSARLLLALLFTLFNYAVLTGYDQLAMRFIKKPLRWSRTMLAAFISYAFSNNVGLSILGASAVRYRMYASWGLSGVEIGKVVAFSTVTFHLGLCAVGGALLILWPPSLPAGFPLREALFRPIGVALLICAATYVLLCALQRRTIRIKGVEFKLPSLGMAGAQLALSGMDWAMAGTALYVLLPDKAQLHYPTFMGMFLLAQTVGIASQIPGGLGVFESMMLVLLTSRGLEASEATGVLVMYRLIYYLLPLALATLLMGMHEALERRAAVRRFARIIGTLAPGFVPQLLAVMTFICGAIMLFAGATPISVERMRGLNSCLPLAAIEISHLLASAAGMGLLILARGLRLRLASAWTLTVALLLAGGVFSAARADYEEAVLLVGLLMALLPCRVQFYRKGALLDRVFSPAWTAAAAVALGLSIWLGFFSYKHVTFSGEMWWQFSMGAGNAPRFLRATAGAVGLGLLAGIVALLRPAPPRVVPPEQTDWPAVERVAAASRKTIARLALVEDKSVIFSSSRKAFIMYAKQGRSWVAMGDPVGPRAEWNELGWRFREMVDRRAGWPVFYNVGSENEALYLDLGLTLVKLGEEAHVPLPGFSLDGEERAGLRALCDRLKSRGCIFEMVPAGRFDAIEPDLRRISDAWLASRNAQEKHFSTGCFKPGYLRRFPIAIVRCAGDIVAFANVWEGAEKEELSADLTRHSPDAPAGTTEFMLTELMLWGRQEGYAMFNLGLTPLPDIGQMPLASLWRRVSGAAHEQAAALEDSRSLRECREQFRPEWQARYMALPGGPALPHIVKDLSTIIGGETKGMSAT